MALSISFLYRCQLTSVLTDFYPCFSRIGGDIYTVATLHRETNNTTHTFFRMGRETVSIKEKKKSPHMVCRPAPFYGRQQFATVTNGKGSAFSQNISEMT